MDKINCNYNKTKKYKNYFSKIILLSILLINLLITKNNKIKKIGVVGVRCCNNIGANLLKYAISIKLAEFGFLPYIIGTHYKDHDISFLKNKTKSIIIKNNFSEIKKKQFDILMVNSDQTWRKFDKHFYDYGFLKFAKDWKIPKFVYGASLGYSKWKLTQNDENIIKSLLKNFSGVSVREKTSIELIQNHLGIKPIFVLDPTLLIDKKYYLNLITSFKTNNNISKSFIFTYIIKRENNIQTFIKNSSKELSYEIINDNMNEKNAIEKFIYGIVNCKAVITDSYHGTIFSIIFNKPFVTFIFSDSPKERFISLKDTFKIENRIFEYNKIPNISLLITPLNINYTLINMYKNQSINFLKKNLGII